MAPILLVETRADGDEEEAELEDLSGKVKMNAYKWVGYDSYGECSAVLDYC